MKKEQKILVLSYFYNLIYNTKIIILIMKKIILGVLFIVLYPSVLSAQEEQDIIYKMIEEVTYLASDKLEGRATGTESEKLAAEYIISKFKQYNLIEKGENGYLQSFEALLKENPHSQDVKKKNNRK